ncbi:hypothetical protein XU18_2288 [Perkinsela sp. CCAP 1560/4]|nr:hypothetical protein XU18_2288 [Perkinsela sp. CCAP 1560/4]|eukprot:KNH07017.1 hypothetical protein XU18_2288 [Perkinsela sp. CCAP 1560/4]
MEHRHDANMSNEIFPIDPSEEALSPENIARISTNIRRKNRVRNFLEDFETILKITSVLTLVGITFYSGIYEFCLSSNISSTRPTLHVVNVYYSLIGKDWIDSGMSLLLLTVIGFAVYCLDRYLGYYRVTSLDYS